MSRKGITGTFRSEEDLIAACRKAREEGFVIRDAYTPFAVHGLDEAMGLRPSRLGVVCFILGLLGLSLALGFQLWTSAWDWPLNIGGKSVSALPALIPVTFELTILFAAVGTVIAIFIVARLLPGRQPALPAPGITDDRFVLVLEASDGGLPRARKLLEEHRGEDVTESEGGP